MFECVLRNRTVTKRLYGARSRIASFDPELSSAAVDDKHRRADIYMASVTHDQSAPDGRRSAGELMPPSSPALR